MMPATGQLTKALFLMFFLPLFLPACRTMPTPEEKTITETRLAEPAGTSSTAPTETATAEPTAVPTPEPTPDLLLPITGLTEISLLTPEENVGLKPLFEWEELDSAESYTLILYHPNGEPYWSWKGEGTKVYLGGGDRDEPPPEDSAGPILMTGMTWGVLAFDADGKPIGTSAISMISP